MIKKTSKQNSKEKKIKNDTKNKKKQVLKKTKSSNLKSKNISNKPKPKKTSKSNLKIKEDIVLKRSSGREEKFDTDKLTQTVSRSGVSFPVARDVAKSITKKIKKSVQNKSTGTKKKKQRQHQSSLASKQKLKINTKKEPEKVIVTASQIKNLVNDELKERNQQDHSPSFSGNTSIGEELSMKITLNDREPVMDKVAANKNKVLYDPSKQKGSS
ncbi:MAG TPA: hypothetical protein VFR65_05140 [Nitrososphaeraceae archaeon]|jgi:hypothetical protein|nr:hypothetical protein [Nitrososphaeraceae archaeon]HSL13016.1 hypothetical protein [Nitrososphaeraceae archaeon]